MKEVFKMQKEEANQVFARYIQKNYKSWLHGESEEKLFNLMFCFVKSCFLCSTTTTNQYFYFDRQPAL